MKHILLTAVLALAMAVQGFAQDKIIEGTSYFLPKTALKFTLLVEKTTFTPGELADYANRYFMQGDEVLSPLTTYRIINMRMESVGIPDSAKYFTAMVSPKYTIQKVFTNEEGVLLSVNAEPAKQTSVAPFTPAAKPEPLNPRDHMSQEILSVGSKAKMAQMCAKEIFDIREARNELTRGQAETMPKDGEQLRLMMESMDEQEAALLSLFNGVTVKDTLEQEVVYCNAGEVDKDVLFRFSEFYGLCEHDDLAGDPYYVTVKDLHQTPEDNRPEKERLKAKDETGLHINVPGRAHVTIYQQGRVWVERDFSFAQFGRMENLSTTLFNKKVMTTLELVPSTGAIANMKSESPM